MAVVPEPSQPWPEAFAAAVGQRVAEYRRKRGLTAQQLSDELKAQLGLDMKRTVIGGLESGVRKAVTLTEIMGLAYVLRVSPLLLLFPVGTEDTIEVLPGRSVDTWAAAKWFSGEAIFPTHWPDDHEKAWRELRETALPLQLYREHERMLERRSAKISERDGQRAKAAEIPADTPEEHLLLRRGMFLQQQEWLEKDIRDHDDVIRSFRDQMKQAGVTPPDLPTEHSHLDTARGT